MLIFNDIIHALKLVEIPLRGASFTWSNMQEDPLLEQLYWFLTSNHWTSSYPNTSVQSLARPVSDHLPCLFFVQSNIPRTKRFCFENFWVSHPGFKDVVASAWQSSTRASDPARILSEKFKTLRRVLKRWSKSLSRLSLLLDNSSKVLQFMDSLEEKKQLFPHEWNFRNILKAHIDRLQSYQQQYWRRRCTV